MQSNARMAVRLTTLAMVLVMLMLTTLTPAAVLAAPAPAASQQQGQYHVIRAGETLSQIAQQYGVGLYALMSANMIPDPDQIYSGQRLVIPSGMEMGGMEMGGMEMGGMEMGGMDSMGWSDTVACREYHTVQRGETGMDIAREYGVSSYSLAQANGLDDVNSLWGGQKLCIPSTRPPVNAPSQPKVEMPKAEAMPMPEQRPMPEPMPMPMPEQKPMPMPEMKSEPMTTMKDGCTIHVVSKGETLSKIAMAYGTNMYQIMRLNGIKDANTIYAGQWLKIMCEGGDMGWMPEPMPMPMPEQRPMPMPEQRPMPEPMPMPEQRPMPMPEQRPMPEPMPMPEQRPMPMPEQRPMPEPMPMPMPEQRPMPEMKPMPEPMPMMPSGHKPMEELEQGPWMGYYYCDKYFGGDPVLVREDYDIRFNWYGGSPGEGIPNDNFSIKWERMAYLDGGYYRFVASVDDGVRIYVDDELVLDGWREQPVTEYSAEFFARPGHHKFRVEYYEEGNVASIRVRLERR